MANKLITPDEMAREVWDDLKRIGIIDFLENASPDERAQIIKALANLFGARFKCRR